MKTRHRSLAIFTALALVTAGVAAHPPDATISILTHDLGDPSPRRVETAISLGGAAIRFLITWTAQRAF